MITTTIKSFEYMTLQELLHLKNKNLIKRYNEEIKSLQIDKIAKEVIDSLYGEPLYEILNAIEQSRLEIISTDLYPNEPIIVYPGIREVKAKEEYTCDFSGAKIHKGNLYVNYRPMLKNINNGNTYVIKRTIKTELSYIYDLPTNIAELEEFNDKILNYDSYCDENIQYEHLYNITGGLHFKKLSRRKKYENRNNK